MHDHFVAVFGTAEANDVTLDFTALGIGAIDLTDQEILFSAEEVWTVIKAMPSDRAPDRMDSLRRSTRQPGISSNRTS